MEHKIEHFGFANPYLEHFLYSNQLTNHYHALDTNMAIKVDISFVIVFH